MCGPRSIIRKSETKMFMCSYIFNGNIIKIKWRMELGLDLSWNNHRFGLFGGPLLFLIFINDIVDEVNCPIKLFADDTSIYAIVDNPLITSLSLNSDLQKVQNCMCGPRSIIRKSETKMFMCSYIFNGNIIKIKWRMELRLDLSWNNHRFGLQVFHKGPS
jgi:hypothetical protein